MYYCFQTNKILKLVGILSSCARTVRLKIFIKIRHFLITILLFVVFTTTFWSTRSSTFIKCILLPLLTTLKEILFVQNSIMTEKFEGRQPIQSKSRNHEVMTNWYWIKRIYAVLYRIKLSFEKRQKLKETAHRGLTKIM